MKRLWRRRYGTGNTSEQGMSILEYAVLIVLCAAACATMFTYVMRAAQAQVRNMELELNAAVTENATP